MDRPFARRTFFITLRDYSAIGSTALTRNCWWIFRVNYQLGVKFRTRVNFRLRVRFWSRVNFWTRVKCRNRVLFCSEVVWRALIASAEQINPGGYAVRKPSDLLLVKWLGILSTKSCFRMVGRPMIKSMLVCIVLAIGHSSSSVILLSLLNNSKLNISFLLLTTVCAPFHVMLTVVGWRCMFEGR